MAQNKKFKDTGKKDIIVDELGNVVTDKSNKKKKPDNVINQGIHKMQNPKDTYPEPGFPAIRPVKSEEIGHIPNLPRPPVTSVTTPWGEIHPSSLQHQFYIDHVTIGNNEVQSDDWVGVFKYDANTPNNNWAPYLDIVQYGKYEFSIVDTKIQEN